MREGRTRQPRCPNTSSSRHRPLRGRSRFFDVTVEYAKADRPDDCPRRDHRRRTAGRRRPTSTSCRSSGSATPGPGGRTGRSRGRGSRRHPRGRRHLRAPAARPLPAGLRGRAPKLLFCENDTNLRRLRCGQPDAEGPFKDGLHAAIVVGDAATVNPARRDQARPALRPAPGARARPEAVRLRLLGRHAGAPARRGFRRGPHPAHRRGRRLLRRRCRTGIADAESRTIFRQASAGLILVEAALRLRRAGWLQGDPAQPAPPPERDGGRNTHWRTLQRLRRALDARQVGVPVVRGLGPRVPLQCRWRCIDPDFAKKQLLLLTREWYMHPNGQIPAYEWAFGDVNPPGPRLGAWRVFEIDRDRTAAGRRPRLPRARLPQAPDQLHLVGEPQGRRRPTTSSRAASSGSTTSAPFDRSRPAPRLRRWSLEPTAPRGWRCMPQPDARSPSNWRSTQRPVYEDVATRSSSSTSCLIAARDDRHRRRGLRALGRGRRVLLRRPARHARRTPWSRCASVPWSA